MSLLLHSTWNNNNCSWNIQLCDLFHQLISEVKFNPDVSITLQNISWKTLVYFTVKAWNKQRHLLKMCLDLLRPETSWKPSQTFSLGTYHSCTVSTPFFPTEEHSRPSPELCVHLAWDGSRSPQGSNLTAGILPKPSNTRMDILKECLWWFCNFDKMCSKKGKL